MGNFSVKSKLKTDNTGCKTLPIKETRFRNFNRPDFFSECGASCLDSAFDIRSFRNFSYCGSVESEDEVIQPWSRRSRRRWSERTLSDPLVSAKTTWPVPLMESLFLPEFKIKNDISEESFVLLGSIARGAFGKVYKVMKKDTEEIYAMKVLSKYDIVASNSVKQVKDEVKIQQVVGHHPFIVNCPFFWQSRKKLYIISEFISGGELLKLLQNHGPLDVATVKIYVAEIAIVLDFLHNAGIIYRDLKLENILLDNRNHIQIIDFGLSKWLKYGLRTNTLCGTLNYIAPEILRRQPYGHSADWWSLGIVFLSLLTGQCPYPCPLNEGGEVHQLPEMECGDDTFDLARRLLTADPNLRLHSLTALKRTAFFKNFNFDDVRTMNVEI